MTLFSKGDKKILIILITAIVVILLFGFVIYQYMLGSGVKVQNITGGAGDQGKPTISAPEVQIEAQGGNDPGSLSICSDKCGDGICQRTDTDCGGEDNPNCTCLETAQECPQDCE
jgi:hypothetical protein